MLDFVWNVILMLVNVLSGMFQVSNLSIFWWCTDYFTLLGNLTKNVPRPSCACTTYINLQGPLRLDGSGGSRLARIQLCFMFHFVTWESLRTHCPFTDIVMGFQKYSSQHCYFTRACHKSIIGCRLPLWERSILRIWLLEVPWRAFPLGRMLLVSALFSSAFQLYCRHLLSRFEFQPREMEPFGNDE